MKPSMMLLFFVFLSGLVCAQDTIVLERTYIWEWNSEEMTDSGEIFVFDLYESIRNYRKSGREVEVIFVEEILHVSSVCKATVYRERLKNAYLEKFGSELKGVEFSCDCERVDDFDHLKPHSISYYIKLVIERDL
jgi:hypothetical protein